VVTALKQDRARLPRLRVLVHTRNASAADDAWALAAGCDGVLHKPASSETLVREVRRIDGMHAVERGGASAGDGDRP
jgi:CheY-like chemotaxis protein